MMCFNKYFNMKFFNVYILANKLDCNPLFSFEVNIGTPYYDGSFYLCVARFCLGIEFSKNK